MSVYVFVTAGAVKVRDTEPPGAGVTGHWEPAVDTGSQIPGPLEEHQVL